MMLLDAWDAEGWMFVDVCGCLWMFVDVCGCLWMFVDVFDDVNIVTMLDIVLCLPIYT
jgi:hypothetical protein